MPKNDKYGAYKGGRVALGNVCNGGDAFTVYRVCVTPEVATSHQLPREFCAILCGGTTEEERREDSEWLLCMTMLPQIFVRIPLEGVASIHATPSITINKLLYEIPPRMATTSIMGRHKRDLHIVPVDASSPCTFRVTGIPYSTILHALESSGLSCECVDLTENLECPRGTIVHRTLPPPPSSDLTEIHCVDGGMYWKCRDVLATHRDIQDIFDTSPHTIRWLPAENTHAFEIVVDRLDRASEQWISIDYKNASPAERADKGVFKPSKSETRNWGAVLPQYQNHDIEFEFEFDVFKVPPPCCVYTWEQLAAELISRVSEKSRVAVSEPLASYVNEQAGFGPKKMFRSEAKLHPSQSRQLNDATYVTMVRHGLGMNYAVTPELFTNNHELQAAHLIIVAYLLGGFYPRRPRPYAPNGKNAGITGRPRTNWANETNQETYSGTEMVQYNQKRLKRTIDGAYVRHSVVVPRIRAELSRK